MPMDAQMPVVTPVSFNAGPIAPGGMIVQPVVGPVVGPVTASSGMTMPGAFGQSITPSVPAPPNPDLAVTLRQLENARAEGLLSEEDFLKAKKEAIMRTVS